MFGLYLSLSLSNCRHADAKPPLQCAGQKVNARSVCLGHVVQYVSEVVWDRFPQKEASAELPCSHLACASMSLTLPDPPALIQPA